MGTIDGQSGTVTLNCPVTAMPVPKYVRRAGRDPPVSGSNFRETRAMSGEGAMRELRHGVGASKEHGQHWQEAHGRAERVALASAQLLNNTTVYG